MSVKLGRRGIFLFQSLLLGGCLASRLQSQGQFDSSRFDPAQRLDSTSFEQSVTMENSSMREDPKLMQVGVSRDQIIATMGSPNATSTDDRGLAVEEYDFNPDGSKFVNPKVYPRNIAAAVFTAGASTLVRQARIHHAEAQLTVYHLTYGPDGRISSIWEETRAQPKAESSDSSSESAPGSGNTPSQ